MNRFSSLLVAFLVLTPSLLSGESRVISSEKVRNTMKEAYANIADLDNMKVWALLEKQTLLGKEQYDIANVAFSYAYEWLNIGTVVYRQRAEWLIARTYTKLGDGVSALTHAKKCLELTDKNNPGFKDFDFAYSFEVMARAYAVSGDKHKATKYYNKAVDASKNIAKEQDAELFMAYLKKGNWNKMQFGG